MVFVSTGTGRHENRVAEGRVAGDVMGLVDGELAGHDGGAHVGAVLVQREQVEAVLGAERCQGLVIDQCGAAHLVDEVAGRPRIGQYRPFRRGCAAALRAYRRPAATRVAPRPCPRPCPGTAAAAHRGRAPASPTVS